MRYWEEVHTETQDGFDLVLSFSSEDSEPDWDMTEEEKRGLFEQINNGWLLWVVARLEVKKAGVTLGADYLGGCCYASVDDFITGGYYEDMVAGGLSQARETIKKLTEEINA